MGHFLFIMLHIIAMLFTGFIFLMATIPLHIIYAAVKGNKPQAVTGKRKAKA